MEFPMVMTLDTSVFCDEKKFNDAYNHVSDGRREKIDALKSHGDKRLSLGAGVLFDEGLKAFGIADGSLQYGEHKKPYLKAHDDIFFSISHSGDMAVCAFYDREIGIDIEKMRKVPSSVMQKVTTKKEYDYLSGLDEDQKTRDFTRLWTVKESYIKYLGEALKESLLQKIEVTFGEKITLTHDGKNTGVTLEQQSMPGYALCVCYKK